MLVRAKLALLGIAFFALLAGPLAAQRPSIARFAWFAYQGDEPAPAARRGDYHNPILQGFYPDPSIVRAGADYYLVNSTFAYFPGIPIFRSSDLVNWTQIGNAIDRQDQFDFSGLAVSEGMFAPSISAHAGTWYIVDVCVGCGGNFVITAKNPAGPWSKPTFIKGLDGAIDASLFFDDDGSAWIVYNAPPQGRPLYDGHRAIWLQRFDPHTGQATSERTLLVNGGIHPENKPIWIEGPHIFRKNGLYYLIAAEGGTAENHSEVVLRSKSVVGPYGAAPVNPILTQRDLPEGRAHPITSAGHASFIETPGGQWWAVFLATRPYEDGFTNTGRETFLLPVRWRDGWPDILPAGEPISTFARKPELPPGTSPFPTSGSFTTTDHFSGPRLRSYWMMLRTAKERWYSLGHGLLLKPRAVSIGSRGNPSFLARRQQHAQASASTVVRFVPAHDGALAGLVALQNDDYWYFLGLARHGARLFVTLDRRSGEGEAENGITRVSVPFTGRAGTPLYLKITADGARYDFRYGYARDRWQVLKLGEDGTVLSTKRAGGFVGAVFGLYAYDPDGPAK